VSKDDQSQIKPSKQTAANSCNQSMKTIKTSLKKKAGCTLTPMSLQP
jgi:hypothetical protein